jgi:hypothetical protein
MEDVVKISPRGGFAYGGQYFHWFYCLSITLSIAIGNLPTALAEDINNPPSISGSPAVSAEVGIRYVFTPTASDPDGDRLRFNIEHRPIWASFDKRSGRLTGIPRVTDVGTTRKIIIRVSDGRVSAFLPPFDITVIDGAPPNNPPVINGTPVSTVFENTPYTFSPTASDPDGDALTFSISNNPGWAVFDSATGTLFGTPGFADAGYYEGIIISVTDGASTSAMPPFDIQVFDVNRPPSIVSFSVKNAFEQVPYSLMLQATDPDGDSISFHVTNPPPWTSFLDNGDGTATLSGTPQTSDIGTYTDIAVSLSDSTITIALPSFDLVVLETSATATLSWIAPSGREDGTPLSMSELAGFRIYHGTTPSYLSMISDIVDPTSTLYVVEDLGPGTHYFAVTAYDMFGEESGFSTIVSKIIGE